MLNIITENPSQINTASYFTPDEYFLFKSNKIDEKFFGESENDSIQIGMYNEDKELTSYTELTSGGQFKKITYKYEDIDKNTFDDKFY